MAVDIDNEQDIERLRQVAKLQEKELEKLTMRLQELTERLAEATGQEAADLQEELDSLQDELAKHRKARFGQSSERRGRPEDEESTTSTSDGEEDEPQSGHGPTAQPELEVVEELHELDEADRTCPECGGRIEPIDGEFETTEEIDVVRRKYVLVEHKKQKYRCDCNEHIEAAMGPEKLVEGGRYSVGVAVDCAVHKYGDHQPLARQAKRAGRQGLEVQSQTLWDQVQALAEALRPSYEAVSEAVQEVDVIGVDETSWPHMEAGDSRKIWLWAARSRRGVAFRFDEGRNAEAADALLDEFTGTIVTDAHSAYRRLEKMRAQADLEEPRAGPGPIEVAGCMVHARRKFFEAEKTDSRAGEMLDWIAKLYAIEDELERRDDEDLGVYHARREQKRREEAEPILEKMRRWLESTEVLPSSRLGKAITYMTNHWSELTKFADDGRLPLDNNATERALRQPIVGRKNYYGCRSPAGLRVAEVLYTLIGTCRILGVRPDEYLEQAALRAIRNTNQRDVLPHEMAEN